MKKINYLLFMLIVFVLIFLIFIFFKKKNEVFDDGLQEISNVTPETQAENIYAREALINYFDLLAEKKYAEAITYHGSGYEGLRGWNPEVDPDDYVTLLKNACEYNGWVCSRVYKVLSEEKISETEYKFIIQFEKSAFAPPEDTVFTQRPCCGEEDNGFRKTDFEYFVKQEGNNFVVATTPIYVP